MAVPATKVGPKYQVTIPQEVREAVKLKPGDLVQASVGRDGTIILRRKVLVDRDPALERDLDAAEADVEAGRVLGRFDNAPDALRAFNAFKRRAHARRAH